MEVLHAQSLQWCIHVRTYICAEIVHMVGVLLVIFSTLSAWLPFKTSPAAAISLCDHIHEFLKRKRLARYLAFHISFRLERVKSVRADRAGTYILLRITAFCIAAV